MEHQIKKGKIIYIIKDKDKDKWLISNIDGWKITSLYNDENIVNENCVKERKKGKVIWIGEYMGFPSFKIIVNLRNNVKIKYIFQDNDEKEIDSSLSIHKYRLKKLKMDDFEYKGKILIYSTKYKNVIGEIVSETSTYRTVVQLDPSLSYITPKKDGRIYPFRKCCYKLVSKPLSQDE